MSRDRKIGRPFKLKNKSHTQLDGFLSSHEFVLYSVYFWHEKMRHGPTRGQGCNIIA